LKLPNKTAHVQIEAVGVLPSMAADYVERSTRCVMNIVVDEQAHEIVESEYVITENTTIQVRELVDVGGCGEEGELTTVMMDECVGATTAPESR
jgi:hypothetical protein